MTIGMILSAVMFLMLIIALMAGTPLAFALGGIAALFGYFGWGPECLGMFMNRIYMTVMNNYVLVAVPLFVLMANLLDRSEIMRGLFDTMRQLFGPIRGGMAIAVIIVATIFAACTGIVGASIVTISLMSTPHLLSYGYKKELIAGTICAGGTLGILIPPSIMLVLMGSFAGISVGELFMAAVIPGLILSGLYITYIAAACWVRPGWGPSMSAEERAALKLKEILFNVLKNIIPPAILIISVLGSIFTGIATATEAAAVGGFVVLLMAIVYRRMSWKMVKDAVFVTGKVTSMVLFIVVGATCFTGVFIGLGGDEVVTKLILGFGGGKWTTYWIMMFIIIILGMFIDWIGIVMIALPIFIPIAQNFGFDPLWFVMMIAINLQASFLTPPLGYAFFYFKGAGGGAEQISMAEIYSGMVPFIVLMIIGLAICTYFPEVILWLPGIMD
jgi:tripartite ATP-independent transporter DctM subunit